MSFLRNFCIALFFLCIVSSLIFNNFNRDLLFHILISSLLAVEERIKEKGKKEKNCYHFEWNLGSNSTSNIFTAENLNI